MENLIVTGLSLHDLFLRLEQIIDKRLETLAPQVQDSSEYITRKEVARILKVSLPTLHDWTKLGWLQSYKLGNRVLYKLSEVEAALPQVSFHKHKKGGVL